jgi:hypothetical protein
MSRLAYTLALLLALASSPSHGVAQTFNTWLSGTLNARQDLPNLYFAETIGLQFVSYEPGSLGYNNLNVIGDFYSVNLALEGYVNPDNPSTGNIFTTVNLSTAYKGKPFAYSLAGTVYEGTFPNASGTVAFLPEPSLTWLGLSLLIPVVALRLRIVRSVSEKCG